MTPDEIVSLWLRQMRANANYRSYPFSIPAGKMQQVVSDDWDRTVLVLVCFANTGALADTGKFVLDNGPFELSPLDPSYTARGMPLSDLSSLIFPIAPVNAVTMLCPVTKSSFDGVVLSASDP
jgi:hypothetical protein